MLNLVVREVTTGPEARKHVIYARITHAHIPAYQYERVRERVQLRSTMQAKMHKSGCLSFRA